jgi:hypothetical protein
MFPFLLCWPSVDRRWLAGTEIVGVMVAVISNFPCRPSVALREMWGIGDFDCMPALLGDFNADKRRLTRAVFHI